MQTAHCWAEGWEIIGHLEGAVTGAGFLGRRWTGAGPARSGSSLGLVGKQGEDLGPRHAGRKEEVKIEDHQEA